MLKSVLKCIESIRIKKWVNNFQMLRANLGEGGLAKLVKSQLFKQQKYLTLPLATTLKIQPF